MAKVNFPLYMDPEMHKRFKELYEAKYKHMPFYSMFIELGLPTLEKYEKEVNKKWQLKN